MHPQNQSIPNSTIIPEVGYGDVRAAVTWLRDHFGFEERLRIGDHRSQMCFEGGALVVVQRAVRPPDSPHEAAHSIMVRVRNVDARHARAVADGLRIFHAMADYPYGERQFTVLDPGGHVWTFTQTIFDAPPASWGGQLLSRQNA